MSKNFLLRRIFFLLVIALILWSVLTSLVYSQIARPVFHKLKSEDMYNQAAIISYIVSEKDNVVDEEVLRVLSLSIRFYESGVFITDEVGDVLVSKLPEGVPNNLLISMDEEFNMISKKVLSTGRQESMVLYLEEIDQDILLVAVPIIKPIDGDNYLIGSVIMLQTMNELQVSYSSLNIALLISAILVGIIVSIPVIFFAGRIVKPLTDMRNAATAMIEGDFSQRLEPMEDDNEISYLINAFNHLSSELDNTISKLTNERNQLQHIVDGIGEGIIAVNKDREVTQDNEIIWLLFHQNSKLYSADELLVITGLDELFDECLSQQKVIAQTKKSGNDLINCLISPLIDESGVLFGAVGLFRDVTKTEKLEQTRHEYVSNVSHELRTPITAMRGLLEPLHDGLVKSEENKQRYYSILLRETLRLSSLIDDMLELSRIQTSEKTTNLGPVNLQNDLIDMSIRFDVLAEQNNIKLITPDLRQPYPAVWGKAERISQILTIIMDNAIKFTPEGGVIELLINERQNNFEISIKDSGSGIKKEDLPYVFERFYKADKAHNEKGTGLGLSIASELAEQMGHTLSVTSAEGKGSTFTLAMPYAHDIMKSEPHLKDVYESDLEYDEQN